MVTEKKERLIILKEDFDALTYYVKNHQSELRYDQHLQKELLKKLEEAEIISNEDFPNTASRLYSTVIIRDTIARINLEYKLVHPNETDEWNGKISPLTPFGIALMGLQKGDSFTWQLSNRRKYYSVVEIRNYTFI